MKVSFENCLKKRKLRKSNALILPIDPLAIVGAPVFPEVYPTNITSKANAKT